MRPATHQLPPFLALIVLAACARAETPPAAAPKPADDAVATKRDAELLAAAKDAAILKSGKATYTGLCFACHGAATAKGDSPSNLFDGKWFHGSRPSEIERTIQKGVIEKAMPPWGEVLPPEDITAVTAYVLSLQK